MTLKSSRVLVEKAGRGDERAIETLLEQHLAGLRAYVRLRAGALVRARESCSDLVQSVCREVLEGVSHFDYRGEAAFRQWLYTAALRKIVARHRYHLAEKRDAGRETPLTPAGSDERSRQLLQAYSGFHTPSRLAAANEEIEQIERAFEQLPDEYRDVITYSRLMGLSHAEIAEELGKSEGAVRILLHRALARLSLLLAE